MKLNFNEEVSHARDEKLPIVALESTVIAHGLPYPNNIETAFKLEQIVRENGAIPATIAIPSTGNPAAANTVAIVINADPGTPGVLKDTKKLLNPIANSKDGVIGT